MKFLVDNQQPEWSASLQVAPEHRFFQYLSQKLCGCSGATCKVALQGRLESFGATKEEALANLQEAVGL